MPRMLQNSLLRLGPQHSLCNWLPLLQNESLLGTVRKSQLPQHLHTALLRSSYTSLTQRHPCISQQHILSTAYLLLQPFFLRQMDEGGRTAMTFESVSSKHKFSRGPQYLLDMPHNPQLSLRLLQTLSQHHTVCMWTNYHLRMTLLHNWYTTQHQPLLQSLLHTLCTLTILQKQHTCRLHIFHK